MKTTALAERVLDSKSSSGDGGREMLLQRRGASDEEVQRDFSDYLLLEEGRSDQTVRGYCQQQRAVAKMLSKRIVDVSPTDVRYEVKRDQNCAPSTRQLRITSYRQLHMWALLDEKPWANPAMLGVKTPPTPKRRPKPPISLFDARKMLANCQNPNEYRVVYLGLYAGLRVCESARLCEANVRRDRLVFIGKGNKEREVPIHPELAKALPSFIHQIPKSKGVLMDRMTKMRDRLMVFDLKGKPATTHSLRRTFADFLYDKLSVEREVVRMILGHGEEVTDLYAPVRFPKMVAAMGPLDYDMGTPIQLSLF